MKENTDREMDNLMCNIVWLRNHYCLSKKKMAKIIGIGVNSLNKIERGEFPPSLSVEVIFNIYEYFGITPEKQLSGLLGENK